MAFLDTLETGINTVKGILPDEPGVAREGFRVADRYTADGDGLPFQKVENDNIAAPKRNIISWLVPEFGIIKMYINPNKLVITDAKLIQQDKTKGGYTVQYWGEKLTQIGLTGTTGSSGIEGINALYEVYRAEQLAFDTQGLVLDSENASGIADNLTGLASGFLNGLGGNLNANSSAGNIAAGIGGSLLSGGLGLDSTSSPLSTKNIPSIAQYALGVEMYYNGAVYRGFFESMTVTESADNFAIQYDIKFIVTQKRGYRRNYFPFHRNPNGPSDEGSAYTYSGSVYEGQLGTIPE